MNRTFIKIAALSISLLYVDLFCGAGGTSTGIERATVQGMKSAKVIACVNHDKNAIISHAQNHPDSVHFTEDIRTLDLTELIEHVKKMRQLYPYAKLGVWASLECTNHSNAKGGMSRDADSRTLAEHLDRYYDALNPDFIQIEYVEKPLEFFSKYSMPDFMFRIQHKSWLEDIVLPRFPSDLEDWAKDKYNLINRREKKKIEDFSDREIEEEFRERCLKPDLIKRENIINEDFISRIIEITDRGDNAEIDKTLQVLEKAYRIK